MSPKFRVKLYTIVEVWIGGLGLNGLRVSSWIMMSALTMVGNITKKDLKKKIKSRGSFPINMYENLLTQAFHESESFS